MTLRLLEGDESPGQNSWILRTGTCRWALPPKIGLDEVHYRATILPWRVTHVLTVDLCLPDGVSDTPQAGDGEEDERRLRVRPPVQQDDDETGVNSGAQEHERDAADELHDGAEDDGADRVDDAEADHDVADVVDAVRAGHVRLEQTKTC